MRKTSIFKIYISTQIYEEKKENTFCVVLNKQFNLSSGVRGKVNKDLKIYIL